MSAASAMNFAESRAVRRQLADAADDQVLKVVQLIDAMAERGDADGLLAPVRERLRVLRPPRKMRFARLIFLPCDPLIVAPQAWRPDTPLIPRSAVLPLAALVRDGLAAAAQAVEPMIEATSTTDAVGIARIGALLWPRAAALLEAGQMPESWTAQGLPAASFAPLRTAIAFIIGAEAGLAGLAGPAIEAETIERELGALLAAAEKRGGRCWGMMLALLLQRFPWAEAPLRAATVGRVDKAAAEAALALSTGWIEQSAAARGIPDLHTIADEIARQFALLESLATVPSQRQHAAELRTALQSGCAARFEAGLRGCIVERMAVTSDTAGMGVLEQDARDLRRMETEARRLGGGAEYDRQLREVAGRVLGMTQLGRADRVRLIEILAGPKLALQARGMLPE